MWNEFKAFLTKSNALALAVGVIIGAATGKVVTALSNDILMPVIGLLLPHGNWRAAGLHIGPARIAYGDFLGNIVDFVIIAFIVFTITKALLKPAPATPTKQCPFCMETNDVAATKCKACTSAIPETA